jgi:hypothetical protein
MKLARHYVLCFPLRQHGLTAPIPSVYQNRRNRDYEFVLSKIDLLKFYVLDVMLPQH